MKDTIFKLKLLTTYISDAFTAWKTDVWKRELDSYYCCPGQMMDECGCMGTTVREIYSTRTVNDSKAGSAA
jgi:hypothetical protein